MEFFRTIFFSFAAWLVVTIVLAGVSGLLLVPNIPDKAPTNTTIECLSTKPTDKVDPETGFITFDCIRAKS